MPISHPRSRLRPCACAVEMTSGIERVDAVAERAEDVLKGSAVDDQLERSLMNRGQRIANAWRSER
jgi:hypothetical protein